MATETPVTVAALTAHLASREFLEQLAPRLHEFGLASTTMMRQTFEELVGEHRAEFERLRATNAENLETTSSATKGVAKQVEDFDSKMAVFNVNMDAKIEALEKAQQDLIKKLNEQFGNLQAD